MNSRAETFIAGIETYRRSITAAPNANNAMRATTSRGVSLCSFAFPSFPSSMMIIRHLHLNDKREIVPAKVIKSA